jgi:hypothetical protein
MLKVSLAIAALLLSVVALAAAPTSVLTWGAVTTNTDGTTASGITYNVYAAYGTAAQAKISSGVTASTYTDASASLTDGLTACYAVSAVEGGVEGAQSNVACKTFPAAVPSAPVLTVK